MTLTTLSKSKNLYIFFLLMILLWITVYTVPGILHSQDIDFSQETYTYTYWLAYVSQPLGCLALIFMCIYFKEAKWLLVLMIVQYLLKIGCYAGAMLLGRTKLIYDANIVSAGFLLLNVCLMKTRKISVHLIIGASMAMISILCLSNKALHEYEFLDYLLITLNVGSNIFIALALYCTIKYVPSKETEDQQINKIGV